MHGIRYGDEGKSQVRREGIKPKTKECNETVQPCRHKLGQNKKAQTIQIPKTKYFLFVFCQPLGFQIRDRWINMLKH